MFPIAFIDTEIDPQSGRILDIGGVRNDDTPFHANVIQDFIQWLKGMKFICGHNIFHHDLKYIQQKDKLHRIDLSNVIDTLFLSPLLFPAKPYHALLKDDKLQSGFQLRSSKINFILYWKKENTEQEVKIILPELYFERSVSNND